MSQDFKLLDDKQLKLFEIFNSNDFARGKQRTSRLRDFKTSKDFRRLQETLRDFDNRDFRFAKDGKRLQKTVWDFDTLQMISKRLQQTSKDFVRLQRTLWNFTILYKTS